MEIILKLILTSLIAYSATQIIADSLIFRWFRELLGSGGPKYPGDIRRPPSILFAFIKCYICVGFWIGVLCSLYVFSPATIILGKSLYLAIFLDALYYSCVVWIINIIESRLTKE